MIITNATPAQCSALGTWLAALQDPRCDTSVGNAIRDRLPPGWRHDGTVIPTHLNWLVVANGAIVEVRGQRAVAEPGSWLCLPPGTPLHIQPLHERLPFDVLRFRMRLARGGVDLPMPHGGFLLRDARGLREPVMRLIDDAAAGDPFAGPRQRGLLVALYAEAFRRLAEARASRSRSLTDPEAEKIEELIARLLPRVPDPARLAALIRMKPDTFSRAFRRRHGRSPRAWLAARRIHHAAALLLAPDATATAVAEACGYADVFHFCRQFRIHLGCGTRDWRSRHRQA
jgi:AraC-like DNA-binding protein